MKFIARKYSGNGRFLSEIEIDSNFDYVDEMKIQNTELAYRYCKKYLESSKDVKENNYFIVIKK